MSYLKGPSFTLRRADGVLVADRVTGAFGFFARSKGLLGTRCVTSHEGLWLVPGGSVHTFAMRYSIDVLFLDDSQRILAQSKNVPPWRIRRAPRGTRTTLELMAGRADELELTVGDRMCFASGG